APGGGTIARLTLPAVPVEVLTT
ncbi:MAG: hypothetical protein JWQ18_3714, partial [Conexibacter sp.]|nr:hypothetical protein [Conexibacter sp.]